jgi:hypothetical protein
MSRYEIPSVAIVSRAVQACDAPAAMANSQKIIRIFLSNRLCLVDSVGDWLSAAVIATAMVSGADEPGAGLVRE